MKPYELFLAIDSQMDANSAEKFVRELEAFANKHNARFLKTDFRAKQRFAYPIKGRFDSYQFFIEFEAPASSIEAINRQLTLSSEVLRFGIYALQSK